MKPYTNIDKANQKIKELEKELALVKEQLAYYENRQYSGRKKHDAKWQASYDYFVNLYEQGHSIMEIVEVSDFSQRTAYRYKAYYDETTQKKE